jgi:hypothetical protein
MLEVNFLAISIAPSKAKNEGNPKKKDNLQTAFS